MPEVERLKQLRRVVEAAPEDRLHMRRWSERAACGTAYCAAGWAAIDLWFQANTEILGIFHVLPTETPGEFEVIQRSCFSGRVITLGELFGLSESDANALFAGSASYRMGPHAVTKAEVLANIDRLLAGQPAVPYAAVVACPAPA